MIVRMRHLDLVCTAADRASTLEKLRQLGVVHFDLASAQGAEVVAARTGLEDAEKAVRLIVKARGGSSRDDFDVRPLTVENVLALAADRETLAAERDRLEREIRQYESYGDFDPELARRMLEKAGELREILPAKLPAMRLSRMREKLSRVINRIGIDTAKLAAGDDRAILKAFPQLVDVLSFAQAAELLREKGLVAVISGWVPAVQEGRIRDEARANGWGVLLRASEGAETPPTLIEPPRIFRPMKALFNGLGIAPAYTEADVSVPFMCYFSLFFAMLVGDGAYGAIFLGGTLLLRKRLPRAWFALLVVFSSATILWGCLSNTWFGAGLPWCANWPTVKWLADPSYHNMMLLCFTIGVSHLMLARLWNGLCKLNDSTCVAEFGWAGVLLFMYFVTNSIVGIFAGIPTWAFWMFGVSLVAVFGFTVKPSELKSRGAELGMLPLNIMSALGDIISYVRLFAVGLASVKVAENFNSMAVGLMDGGSSIWAKALLAVMMAAILLVGHSLNLAMAGLSILVHAVRLNTLEFSNHKGVSWAGYAFKPFTKAKE